MNASTNSAINNQLARRMMYGIFLGIVTGLFFGQLAQKLQWIGHAYIMLVEAAVFPYLISSLLHGIGSLQPNIATRLFKRSWLIYLILLFVSFVIIMGVSWLIPKSNALAVSTSLTASLHPNDIELSSILLPSNIFSSLAHGYVPAVVIFALLSGIAMQRIPQKNVLLQFFDAITHICIELWKLLLGLAPIAVFCLMASIAGTINLQQLVSFGIYFIVLLFIALLLIFWVFPVFITCFANLSYRKTLALLKRPLILTTTTTLTVLSIPMLQDIINELLNGEKINDLRSKEIVETITLVNYPFIQVGNIFIYAFMLFAAFYYHQSIDFQTHFSLPLLSFLSSIGTPNSTINGVNFLTQWLHLSDNSITLYASILPIIQFVMIPTSLMAYAAMTILTALNYYGLLEIKLRKLMLHLILIFLAVIVSITFIHRYFPIQNVQNFEKLKTYSLDQKYTSGLESTVIPMNQVDNIVTHPSNRDGLFRIEMTKTLRVGYNPTAIPFAFFNHRHELVGYDIAYAYILAKSMGVNVEFVPFRWNNLTKDLNDNKFDIAMAGAYVTPQRLEKLGVSSPYYSSSIALIVPKSREKAYSSIEGINKNYPNLRIAVDLPLATFARQVFPNAKITIRSSIKKIGNALLKGQADIGVSSHIQGQMWIAHGNKYTLIVPKKLNEPVLLGFMVSKKSPLLLNYVNYLLLLKEKDGFQQAVYEHWILAKPLFQKQRWSIMHNVLGL